MVSTACLYTLSFACQVCALAAFILPGEACVTITSVFFLFLPLSAVTSTGVATVSVVSTMCLHTLSSSCQRVNAMTVGEKGACCSAPNSKLVCSVVSVNCGRHPLAIWGALHFLFQLHTAVCGLSLAIALGVGLCFGSVWFVGQPFFPQQLQLNWPCQPLILLIQVNIFHCYGDYFLFGWWFISNEQFICFVFCISVLMIFLGFICNFSGLIWLFLLHWSNCCIFRCLIIFELRGNGVHEFESSIVSRVAYYLISGPFWLFFNCCFFCWTGAVGEWQSVSRWS